MVTLREMTAEDIGEMHAIRLAVTENPLRNPTWVLPEDYRRLHTTGGRGWVCTLDGAIRGFGMADHPHRSVWALFVAPGFERRGIGRALHDAAVDWLFAQDVTPIRLSTAPGTRAEKFYADAGWQETARRGNAEIFFEMRTGSRRVRPIRGGPLRG